MRSTKLAAALLAAAASLTLSCAAAPAAVGRVPSLHEGGTHGHGCRVTLDFAYRVIEANQPAVAVGKLTCAKAAEEAGQAVTLYERPATSATYTVAATGTTEATGAYSVEAKGVTTDSVFYVIAGGIPSAHKAVDVIAEVKLEGPPEGVLFTSPLVPHHRKVPATFKGKVSPADEGARVVLQRQNALSGNGWYSISLPAVVNKNGEFTIEHDFVVPGPANIRVLLRDPKVNLPSASNVLSYEVSQRENPQFTIESTADPISYGQSTTIGGKVTGVASGTAVKLLARAANQDRFAVVGETHTSSEGKYSFGPLTPLVGTYYRTEGAGKSSAVMFEGVKYVLTATLSPGTTIPRGTELTFAGTVKPGVVGHIVYVEREDASHTAFNVVGTGVVHAPEPPTHPEYWYSINFAPVGVGTIRFRVKIPGDPQNGSTESETFTVTVTPAPASALKPLPSPTLPSEGQV